jgi:MGT family glycosyltransferase
VSARFLLAMWEGGGTVPPLLGVARRLIGRGHRVRVLGDPTIQIEAEKAGCAFTPWRRAPHRTDLRPESDRLRDWEAPNPVAMLRKYRDEFLVAPAAAQAADALEAIAREAPDVVATDFVLFGASMAAERAGIPSVALIPQIWPLPVRGAPPFGMGLPLARGALGRIRDRLANAFVARLFERGLPRLNATRRELALAPLASFFDQVLGARALLVLSSASFDFSAPFVPANARYVGPVLDDPDWAGAPWTPPWESANRDPIVLVAFSTTFQDQAGTLRRIVDALAKLPVRGLVTLGEMLDDSAVLAKGAVAVVRSAPHREVLRHASLVVTHCGHGTTVKALAAGVPMVCLPMGRDQDDNAARVAHHGAGVRLSPKASASEIARGVARVLGDERYRVAARDLGRRIAADAAQDTAVDELEAAASR